MGLTDLFEISLERANQFYAWGWRLSVVGAVVTMLGIAALWLGTRVRDHDFESKISLTTLSAEQLHKDNLTLQTNLETERIARLQLEGKTEGFRLDIAKSNQAAEEAKERILNAGKEVAKLQTDAADAKRRQAEAEIKLAEVRKRQEPRMVREDIILPILATAPPGKIKMGYLQGIPEAAMFANLLNNILVKAKWIVLQLKPLASVLDKGYSGGEDLLLMMPDLDHMNPSGQALQKALRSAGYNLTTIRDETLPADILLLWIGPKL